MVVTFDDAEHVYRDEHGVVLPSITQMLTKAGYVDDAWFTPQSRERGSKVHKLTELYDLGALDPRRLSDEYLDYQGWLNAHAAATTALRPVWHDIEVYTGHPRYRFAGRPDRNGVAWEKPTCMDIKSGVLCASHAVQTALQVILLRAQPRYAGVRNEDWQRLALYLQGNGKYKLVQHHNVRDFDRAMEVIRTCAG